MLHLILKLLRNFTQMVKTSRIEPALGAYANSFVLYLAATRPAFLLATFAACLIGLVGATFSGVKIQPFFALVTIVLALLVHAAVNVLNDYFDALNGTDAVNVERLYSFTGGSRFIQNGVLALRQTACLGYALLGAAVLGGIWLSWQVGSGLLWIGGIGVLVGWSYSAVEPRLNARGLGELCVLTGFLGVVIGADYVQRHAFSLQPVVMGMAYALLVTNLLYINQFPDRKADAQAGKRNLVVRLPLEIAAWGYLVFTLLALLWIVLMVWVGAMPELAIVSTLPLLFSLWAFRHLKQFAAVPAKLLLPIQLTLASMLGHALLLSIILFWNKS